MGIALSKPEKQEQTTRTPKSVSRKTVDQLFAVASFSPVQPCALRATRFRAQRDLLKLETGFLRHKKSTKKDEDPRTKEKKMLKKLRGSTLQVVTLDEVLDEDHAIVSSSMFLAHQVGIHSVVDKNKLEKTLGGSVLIHKTSYDVVGILEDDEDPLVTVARVEKTPTESYANVGGLAAQIQEVKEAVELPLTRPELYEEIGIKPPKGVIFYGPPGTGKTLLAKAVAAETSATFLHMVGSELVQKYAGEGPKLVRKLFTAAVENAPAIVFIDEIDAIGLKRSNKHRDSGEMEIQRTMLELLNQLDGFDDRKDVKVIMATNRIESLDSALIRPGRIDRKIEFPKPDEHARRLIFKIHTNKMKLAPDVDLEEFVKSKNDFTGAEIKAICTEAGLLALRERRLSVNHKDLRKAVETAVFRKRADMPKYLYV